ncbi:SpdA protein, partial [Streptomyces sp. TRM76130]|nr:SpdA protein [Streptomyces sp. TRM76130]
LVALIASLGANVATAGLLDLHDVPAWLRILVAGWPAVAFLGGTLLAHGTRALPEAPKTPTAPEAETTGRPETEDPAAPTAPELPTAPAPAPASVPPALVALARKVADEHRTRTGTAIDTSTLRARLGVPMPLAEAIAAHLT